MLQNLDSGSFWRPQLGHLIFCGGGFWTLVKRGSDWLGSEGAANAAWQLWQNRDPGVFFCWHLGQTIFCQGSGRVVGRFLGWVCTFCLAMGALHWAQNLANGGFWELQRGHVIMRGGLVDGGGLGRIAWFVRWWQHSVFDNLPGELEVGYWKSITSSGLVMFFFVSVPSAPSLF